MSRHGKISAKNQVRLIVDRTERAGEPWIDGYMYHVIQAAVDLMEGVCFTAPQRYNEAA